MFSGLPIAEIDTKLATLKSIICDLSDCALLDYLLKADLNVDAAINLHFGSTADGSASPSHIAVDHNHNNTIQHTQNLKNESEASEDELDKEDITSSSNKNENSMNQSKKRKWSDVDDKEDDEPRANKRRRFHLNDNHKENTNNSNSNSNAMDIDNEQSPQIDVKLNEVLRLPSPPIHPISVPSSFVCFHLLLL